MDSSDPLLTIASAFPLVLAGAGLGFIWWTARTRFPAELEGEVLEALSEREALPLRTICSRAPLAGRSVDPTTVASALEHLRQTGRAVRWYAPDADQEVVYRRVA
jgi:hypothetical protein